MKTPYLINILDLANLILPNDSNNPAAPLFDCVNMTAFYKDGKKDNRDLYLYLNFGTHALQATDGGDRVLKFSIRLRKAQLRLCVADNVKIPQTSLHGIDAPVREVHVKTDVAKKNANKSFLGANTKLSGQAEVVKAQIAAGIEKATAEELTTRLTLEELDMLFQFKSKVNGQYTWEALPGRPIEQAGNIVKNEPSLDGTYFSVASGPLLSFRTDNPKKESNLILGVAVHPNDIIIEFDDMNDNAWWQELLKTVGFKSKLSVARAALSALLTKGTGQKSDLEAGQEMAFFAIAAAVPEGDE